MLSNTTYKTSLNAFFAFVLYGLLANTAFAAGGGLNSATTEATSIRVWLYGFLGVCAIIYLLYLVLMVLMERKQWGDVGVGVATVAVAGGSIALGEWAWSIWGS